MPKPLVSIIIPCYNAEAWVGDCIQSALAQSWRSIEIILIDDGSKDQSLSVARAIADPRLKIVAQQNQGASTARNKGLSLAQGDEIQFLDADDLLHPQKIARQLDVRSTTDRFALLSGEWDHFCRGADEATFEPMPNWRNMTGVEFLQTFYETFAMMQPAAWLARRELLDKTGPWNESLSLNDDGEYFARVMLASSGIVFCPGAKSYYRSGIAGSLSRRQDHRSLDSLVRSVELMVGFLLDADRSQRSREAAAFAWKWTAFEAYPSAPDLAKFCMDRCKALGGSKRPFPAGRKFTWTSKFVGWRLAKRLLL